MTTPASGRTHFSDEDLRATLNGRILQLEAELEGNLIQQEESDADPHDETGAEVFSKNVESLQARLTVVRRRLSALGEPAAPTPPAPAA